jgi:ubiquinone/menaquinone biosynthesis C-methylase UbiE
MEKNDYYNRPKKDSYKTFFWSTIGIILIIMILIILNGCKQETMAKRFIEQSQTSEMYILPYTGIPRTVLEIGCGEGGNLLPYFNRRCKVTGIDKSDSKIDYAQSHCPYPYDVEFINEDIFKVNSQKYDLIIIKDVLEHLNCKNLMDILHRFMKDDSKVFITFSPWCMPFGGHQQCCKSFLRYIPYLHLLPFYESLLRLCESPAKVNALMEIKETRLSIRRFKKIIKDDYRIEKEAFWLINPSYDARFGLKPVKFINVPFLTTSYWCLISKDK